jgi:hypothetical protein
MVRVMETDMRLIDQPATLEWFPALVRIVRFGEKIAFQPQRKSFETVAAAVRFVNEQLSKRDNPTIIVSSGVSLEWEFIQVILRDQSREVGDDGRCPIGVLEHLRG